MTKTTVQTLYTMLNDNITGNILPEGKYKLLVKNIKYLSQ